MKGALELSYEKGIDCLPEWTTAWSAKGGLMFPTVDAVALPVEGLIPHSVEPE
jgi:hypothetical protein